MYFTINDGSKNTFVYQETLDTIELKKSKGTTDYVRSWKLKEKTYIILNSSH